LNPAEAERLSTGIFRNKLEVLRVSCLLVHGGPPYRSRHAKKERKREWQKEGELGAWRIGEAGPSNTKENRRLAVAVVRKVFLAWEEREVVKGYRIVRRLAYESST